MHPTPQPSVHPSQQPSLPPTKVPSAFPSVPPTRSPSNAPTSVPNGEWTVTLDRGSSAASISRIDDTLWNCYAGTGMCATIGATLGNIIAEYAFPWDTTIHVESDSSVSALFISGHSTSGSATESTIARCSAGTTELLLCNMYIYSGVLLVKASANTDFNKIVLIGRTTSSTAVATLFDTITNTATSYTYTSYLLKTTTLQCVQSIPNFIGTFVAGSCVTNTVIPQNCIFTGWLRSDTGTMDAMYLTPMSGTIRNTAALVASLPAESTGPDSFIAGGLELIGGGGVHAYVLRMNTLYRTIKYGMRYRIAATTGTTASGNRRTLIESTAYQSSASSTLLLNNNLYMVINYHNNNNISSVAILNINTVNGGIVKQVYLATPGANLHCSDIITSGLFLVLACTTDYYSNSTSLLISVNRDLSFTKLPVGLIKHQNHVASMENVPFRATVLAMSTKSVPISATSTRQEVTSEERPAEPSEAPSMLPSLRPSMQPSSAPSGQPSSSPTSAPSVSPQPTSQPSTGGPTNTFKPTVKPTQRPSTAPSRVPTVLPTVKPTAVPTARPTVQPSVKPSTLPTPLPTTLPSLAPLIAPTKAPASKPTARPVSLRTRVPTCIPSTVVNHTEYVDVESGHGNGKAVATAVGAAAAGAVVGAGLLLILFCAWCRHSSVEMRKKKLAAKRANGEAAPSPAVDVNDSDVSVNLSSLHSSEMDEVSQSGRSESSSYLFSPSEMSQEISQNSSTYSLYTASRDEWEVESDST